MWSTILRPRTHLQVNQGSSLCSLLGNSGVKEGEIELVGVGAEVNRFGAFSGAHVHFCPARLHIVEGQRCEPRSVESVVFSEISERRLLESLPKRGFIHFRGFVRPVSQGFLLDEIAVTETYSCHRSSPINQPRSYLFWCGL